MGKLVDGAKLLFGLLAIFVLFPAPCGYCSTVPEQSLTAGEKFAATMESLKIRLKSIDSRTKSHAVVASTVWRLLELREAVMKADEELRLEFDEVGKRCVDAGFSDVITQRHFEMRENHNKNVRRLLDGFRAMERAASGGSTDDIINTIGEMRSHLEQYEFIADPPILSNDLPVRSKYREAPVIQREKPVLHGGWRIMPGSKEEKALLEKLKKRKQGKKSKPKAADARRRRFSPAPPAPPGPADLAPTLDAPFSDEIVELASSLDRSALKIYKFVRENCDFEAYFGSRKGALQTLLQKGGNDYDLASLLIALFRASGIPSRYVSGTIEIPASRAMNWLGVDDPRKAASILRTAGMEGAAIAEGDQVVAVQFRHVWVTAHIPYGNYRGVPNDSSGRMWIPMDPSIKTYEMNPGVDIASEMGFDGEAFVQEYISTFHESSPMELYLGRIRDYLAENHPDLGYEDITRTRRIKKVRMPFISASPPFRTLRIDGEFSEIPSHLRYKIRFMIYHGLSTMIDYTATLPEILGKRLTISYNPESDADWEVVDEYEGLYHSPPHLVHVTPVLRIDGIEAAIGESGVGMGVRHHSDIHFIAPTSSPAGYTEVVYNEIVAGTYQGVGLSLGGVAPWDWLSNPYPDSATHDEWAGGKLWKTAMEYLDRVDSARKEAEKTLRVVCVNDVEDAIIGYDLKVISSFGAPQGVELRGLYLDADRTLCTPVPVDGNPDRGKSFMHLIGAEGSIGENRIFEDVFGEEALSAVKILSLSSDSGIPICTIRDGIDEDCPGLDVSESVRNAIMESLAQGRVITIPQREIEVEQWKGTGYIDLDPVSRGGGYMIAGGHSGGVTILVWGSRWLLWFDTFCRYSFGGKWEISHRILHLDNDAFFPWFDESEFMAFNKLHFTYLYTAKCSLFPDREWSETEISRIPTPIAANEYETDHMSVEGVNITFTMVNVVLTVTDDDNPDRTATNRFLSWKPTLYIPETTIDETSTGEARIKVEASEIFPDGPDAGRHALWKVAGGNIEGEHQGNFMDREHVVVLKPDGERAYEVNAGIDIDKNGILDIPHEISRLIEVNVLNLDLEFQDLPEETEEDPGGYLLKNNNDNAGGESQGRGNNTPDISDEKLGHADKDLIPISISYQGDIPAGYEIAFEIVGGDDSAIHVWNNGKKEESITLPKVYTVGSGALPSEFYIEGMETGEATIGVTLKDKNKEDFCKDKVRVSVIEGRIDGHFKIIEEETAMVETDDEGKEKAFRTLGGMRLHLEGKFEPRDAIVDYEWSSTSGRFFPGYESSAEELTGDDLRGGDLTDIYWQGEYSADLDETITIILSMASGSNVEVERKIKSRVLQEGLRGDDVRMLRAFLRMIGTSFVEDIIFDSKQEYGWRKPPVTITSDFDEEFQNSVYIFQHRNEIARNFIVDDGVLEKIRRHWNDYSAAYESFSSSEKIGMGYHLFPGWLKDGAWSWAGRIKMSMWLKSMAV